jgi:glucoamylase
MRHILMLRKLARMAFAVAMVTQVSAWAAPATGGPGAPSVWAPSQKSMLGTSATDTSRVYFTGYRGVISEVFWPIVDTVNTVDLQFLVGDTAKTFVDEEKQQAYTVTRPDIKSMHYQAQTSNTGHNWSITKTVFTDPGRDTLIMRVTFNALNGKQVKDFNLYVLHNPSMDNSGGGDRSRTQSSGGRTMLVASQNSRASALAMSRPWKLSGTAPMVSHGYVGVNDGYTDLLGGTADKTMNFFSESAGFGSGSGDGPGNIAQMGLVDFAGSTATSISFDMALGFGSTEANAMNAAVGTLGANMASIETTYKNEWNTYANGLSTQGGLADAQYYLAAMTLKASQDKTNGAMIAGMGTPWGETNGDSNQGGYHLIWARDLFKFANALVTAGDTATANKTVNYLFNVQMQTSNCGTNEDAAQREGCAQLYSRVGRFPQNTWVSGWPYWGGTQLDQQAMPIILAERLNRNDLWPKIKQAADYLANTGPRTNQDRWEEQSGYSPSTIAAEIAGLVAAAKIARANNDTAAAKFYLSKADLWQQKVAEWTFTNSGTIGNGNYYVRISPNGNPNNSDSIAAKNGAPAADQRRVVDGGFLELVRLGVKDANDAGILETLPEYDSVLKQTIAGKGPAWFRYNFDGYGEKIDGSNFNDNGGGRGRLWPIFTAERGMYEIAKAGNVGSQGTSYLNTVRAFSTSEGFIPEQVWNNSATLLDNWAVTTPAPYVPGTPSKSIAPLSWAMGEYINLMASIANNRIADVPNPTCSRYSNCLPDISGAQSRMRFNVTLSGSGATLPGQHVYVVGNTPELGNWDTGLAVPVDPRSYPTWFNTVAMSGGAAVQYKYIRKNLATGEVKWENLNGNRTLSMPVAGGSSVINDTVAGWQP